MAEPLPKRHRGGCRQQLLRAQEPQPESHLARLLLNLWSWGDISTPLLQKIAAAAVNDGINLTDLVTLADLGAKGAYPGNMHRELASKLKHSVVSTHLSTIEVAYKNVRGSLGSIVRRHVPILLPHELFSAIHTYYPEAFASCILGGSSDNIGKFWTAMRGSNHFAHHPLSTRRDLYSKGVPLALHGDGVSVVGVKKTWCKSVDAYSWSSLLGKGELITTNFLIFIAYWQLMLERADLNTHIEFSKMLAWSFYWLAVGKWPTRDWNNLPYPEHSPEARRAKDQVYLAGGYYGILYIVRGDLEHMHKAYNFPSAGAGQRCACCKANTSDIPWTDARADALWRGTVWTNAAWKESFANPNPIFELPGVAIGSFIPDVMHCVYLGAYQYAFGSVIQYLTHVKMPDGADANCQRIWQQLKEQYKAPSCNCTLHILCIICCTINAVHVSVNMWFCQCCTIWFA